MKPKDIIIAALVIIILSSFLNGCALIEKKSATNEKPAQAETVKPASDVQDLVKKGEAVMKDAELVLQAEKQENQVTIKISLDNPSKKPITSVQAWLSFDPAVIQGKEVNTTGSSFTIPAPYDNSFDNKNGLVMLGRSNAEPVTAENMLVAEAVFDLVKNETVLVNAYDYREDLSGHTSVNIILDGKPYNILLAPDSPALVIQK